MASSIPEQIIAQVFAHPLLTGVITAVGRNAKEAHAKANRVVAVPLGSPSIDLPDRHGDAMYSDKGRILLVRKFEIEWTCHGVRAVADTADFAQAELLFLNTIIAVRSVTHHSVVFSGEEWEDQKEGAEGFDKFGSVITFTSTIAIPIHEERGVVVTLTATPKIDTTVLLNGNQET